MTGCSLYLHKYFVFGLLSITFIGSMAFKLKMIDIKKITLCSLKNDKIA